MAVVTPRRESADFLAMLRMNPSIREVFGRWVESEISALEVDASAAAVDALYNSSSHPVACTLQGKLNAFKAIKNAVEISSK